MNITPKFNIDEMVVVDAGKESARVGTIEKIQIMIMPYGVVESLFIKYSGNEILEIVDSRYVMSWSEYLKNVK